jgi:UDP-glucose 4-epimerase
MEEMVMADYLVTGGAGFIGSNLAEQLIKDGHRVYIIDNFMTGDSENIPKGAIMRGSFIKLINNLYFGELKGIFHLGQPSSTPMYRANRKLVSKTIEEFIWLMEYAKKHDVRVVYTSTSSVYNGNPVPWVETMCFEALDFYSEVRIAFERLAKVYNSQFGVNSIGLRLFSVYGPREDFKKQYANLITQLIWAKQKNQVFEIYGDGNQRRDATYVSDVVDAFILAMNSKIDYGLFNIGTGVNYTLNKIAKMIGTRIKYVPVPFTGYVDETLANPELAQSQLGFKAQISLEKGLRTMQELATKKEGAV